MTMMRTDLVIALYNLALYHHTGKWSRGYRLLRHVLRYSSRHEIDMDIDNPSVESQRLYRELAVAYKNKL